MLESIRPFFSGVRRGEQGHMRTPVLDMDCGLSNESPKHFGAFTPACSRIYLWSTLITKCVVRGKARCKQRSTMWQFSQTGLQNSVVFHLNFDWTAGECSSKLSNASNNHEARNKRVEELSTEKQATRSFIPLYSFYGFSVWSDCTKTFHAQWSDVLCLHL